MAPHHPSDAPAGSVALRRLKPVLFLITALLFTPQFLTACGGGDEGGGGSPPAGGGLGGNGQKGAFVAGSAVNAYALDATAHRSGATVSATTTDKHGSYALSPSWAGWTETEISGQFFDEYNGKDSAAPLALDAITDLGGGNGSSNVNLFTHLVAARIRALAGKGAALAAANTTAEGELKTLMGLASGNANALNLNDGSSAGKADNALLLLFSGGFMAAGGDAVKLQHLVDDFADDGLVNGVGQADFTAIANAAGSVGFIDRLRSNLVKNGETDPPASNDLPPTLPAWVNEPPVANNATASTAEDTAKDIALSGTDPEGNSLTFSKVAGPAHGTATVSGSTATYTPAANYNGADSFTYKANDGAVDSAPATVSITVTAVNDPPVANAGANQTVNGGGTANLSGSGTDPDGDTLTYSWVQVGTPAVTLTGATTATPSFTAPQVNADTTLTFTLTVSDGHGGTAASSVNVLVKGVPNVPPTANAGAAQTVDEKVTVNLNGSASTDSDGSIAGYAWAQVSGGSVVLTGAGTSTPSFTAPVVSNAEGSKVLVFRLTVTDNSGATAEAAVAITVKAANENPTANAGADQQVTEGTAVHLSGSGTDPDGDALTYSWVQVGIPAVTLTGATTATPSFTAPQVNADTTLTFTLTANDGHGGTASDSVNVLVKDNPVVLPTPTGKLNDTGITTCGDYAFDDSTGLGGTVLGHTHSNIQGCNLLNDAEGDPIPPTLRAAGTGQDGHVGRDVTANDDSDGHAGFSFTKIGTNGAALPANAAAWDCVKDNVTGLIWEVKHGVPNGSVGDSGLHDPDDSYTWYEPNITKNGGFEGYQKPSDFSIGNNDAICYGHIDRTASTECNTKAYVDRVNTAGWCGANDWRLPTREELRSIVSFDRTTPAIDTAYFPNTWSSFFWSSSPDANSASTAVWIVYFNEGSEDWRRKYDISHVRLVRDFTNPPVIP